MQLESSQLEKSMQNRHLTVAQFSEIELSRESTEMNKTTVQQNDLHQQLKNDSTQFEGYLFKRTSKGFKTWNRRWFFLRNNKLLYVYV